MALIVVAVIIVMSLILGAEQGPKVDPTTTLRAAPDLVLLSCSSSCV